jgi:hypothetical protein
MVNDVPYLNVNVFSDIPIPDLIELDKAKIATVELADSNTFQFNLTREIVRWPMG